MSLAEIWRMASDQLKDKHMLQIISFAGSGNLRDGKTVKELRDYFACIPSSYLTRYVKESLHDSFDGDSIVLQELVNEIGGRLGFKVTFGVNQHSRGNANYAGLWKMEDGRSIIIKVTGNTLRQINLDTLVASKEELIHEKVIDSLHSFTLVVVGPGDTSYIQDQIRDSKFASEIRLISMDALLKLMFLKEDLEDPLVLKQILEVLIPHDYIKVDGIIDLLLSVATDVPAEIPATEFVSDDEDELISKGNKQKVPAEFRDLCIDKVKDYLGKPLIKHSRVIYTIPEKTVKVVCLIATEIKGSGKYPYFWFGFRPKQKKVLQSAEQAYLALGCGSEELILLIPYDHLCNWLKDMSTSGKGESINHWHFVVFKEPGNLHLKAGHQNIDLTQYILPS